MGLTTLDRVGKATWLQAYLQTNEDVIKALQMLKEAEVTEDLLSTPAGFVCAAYAPKGIPVKTIPELRWHLFYKHMAEYLTMVALKQYILRNPIQVRVWRQAAIAHQDAHFAQLNPKENDHHRCSPNSKNPRGDGKMRMQIADFIL